ncbi:hypothetical protein CLD22_17000 [Rubrivivax gelatinosus]|nr:hypothetical protein [Rubrivivax gelatinosus]
MTRTRSAAAGQRRRLVVGAALLPFVRTARADELLSFDTLYKSVGVLGIQYSERALALRGQPVRLRGYMAPPLKPESRFFVLTREPVAVCPFCASDAEWPVDIVVVYLRDTLAPVDFNRRVEASGRLEIGSRTDPTTGFVSQVRLVDAQVHEVGR